MPGAGSPQANHEQPTSLPLSPASSATPGRKLLLDTSESCRREGPEKFPLHHLARPHPPDLNSLPPDPVHSPSTGPPHHSRDDTFSIAFLDSQNIHTTATMASMPAATIYPQSHVGFDSITSQIERKLLKRGFQFNVICVGPFLHFPSLSPPLLAPSLPSSAGLTCSRCRPDGSRQVDTDQHHLRLAPHRVQGPPQSR